MTPRQAEAHRLRAEGLTVKVIAERMGVSERRAGALLARAKAQEERREDQDEGLTEVLDELRLPSASMAWIKTDTASVLVRAPVVETDPADLIRQAIDDLRAETPTSFPRRPDPAGPYLLRVGLADVHVGKLCVESETGYRYDRSIAVHRMREGTRALLRRAAPQGVGRILLPIGNDALHVDNARSTTTSGTYQDSDGTISQIYSDAFAAHVAVIEMCAEVAPVDVLYARSNHDSLLGWMLAQQLAAWFRHDPRVTASSYNLSRRHRKYYRYERNLLGETHGDGAKEADLPHLMRTEARAHISECQHLYWYVNHLHHKIRKLVGVTPQKREKDHIGMTMIHSGLPTMEGDNVDIEYVRSPSPPDDWHATHGYINRQAVECHLHHPLDGKDASFTAWF